MNQPSLNYVNCPDALGSHHMAYWQWGDPLAGHVVLCVHGLSRQGRDFDVLAQALCSRASQAGSSLRVICPDVVGRGKSDRLTDPAGYQIATYAADILSLLNQLHAERAILQLDWVGTSMGGLIGMAIAGHPQLPLPQKLRKLVLNDVGPTLEWTAIQRIGAYLGKSGEFDSLQQAADALWAISSGFGPHTPEQWLALSRPMLAQVDGTSAEGATRFKLHYDPAIAESFRGATEASTQAGQAALWELYDHIQAETLLLRGANSDLLSRETAQAMTQRGPRARWVELTGIGHAPTLIASDQVALVADFLLEQ